jgi:transposase-like protein
VVHTPAATRWSMLIDQLEASGQTVRAFATEHDLNPSTLAWWRSRLGRGRPRGEAVAAQPVFDQLAVEGVAPTTPHEGTVVVAIERINVHIVVDRETDLGLLRLVLEALC